MEKDKRHECTQYGRTQYEQEIRQMEGLLRMGRSFDLVGKSMEIGGKKAMLYFVDGFAKDEMMEKMMEYLMKLTPEQADVPSAEAFARQNISYLEASVSEDPAAMVTAILSGQLCLLCEWYAGGILIDARTYPVRGVSEPEDDRVLRGARDGFVETLVFNTALIRRRIRDPRLTMEIVTAGESSHTDIVLCYMAGRADSAFLSRLREKIRQMGADALPLGQQSLAEELVRFGINPFPRIRYTERPDAAAASVLEGSVAVLVDNSPSVMLLPVSIFDFTQDTNDYYFPPLVGSYLRLVRGIIFLLTIFFTPVWYLLTKHPEVLPQWAGFLLIKEPGDLPVIWQLLVLEFVIDGLKLASLNTPAPLAGTFSVVGALVLGDFAVKAGWFVPEVVLYMAFVAISNFTQPSFELGYAFKLFRILLLVLIAVGDVWGFVGGLALLAATLAATRTLSGRCYLYPLVPFNGRALLRLILRMPSKRGE
ncbi:MAG: spore germination protein [Oscillospiraceae bacterium]|jgi:stage V sporulation protein AF|nr:spore germination protein [Oscillospiraceae bacterium]